MQQGYSTYRSRQSFSRFKQFHWGTVAITAAKPLNQWVERHDYQFQRLTKHLERYKFGYDPKNMALLRLLGFSDPLASDEVSKPDSQTHNSACAYMAAFRLIDTSLRLEGILETEPRPSLPMKSTSKTRINNPILKRLCASLQDLPDLLGNLQNIPTDFQETCKRAETPMGHLAFLDNLEDEKGFRTLFENFAATALHIRALSYGIKEEEFPDTPSDDKKAFEIYKSVTTFDSSDPPAKLAPKKRRGMRAPFLHAALLSPILLLSHLNLRSNDAPKESLLLISDALGNDRPEAIRCLEDTIWKGVFSLAEQTSVTQNTLLKILNDIRSSNAFTEVMELTKTGKKYQPFCFDAFTFMVEPDAEGDGDGIEGDGDGIDIEMLNNYDNIQTYSTLQSHKGGRRTHTSPDSGYKLSDFPTETCVDPKLLGQEVSSLDDLFSIPLTTITGPTSNPVSPVQRQGRNSWEDDDALDYEHSPHATPSPKPLDGISLNQSTEAVGREEERARSQIIGGIHQDTEEQGANLPEHSPCVSEITVVEDDEIQPVKKRFHQDESQPPTILKHPRRDLEGTATLSARTRSAVKTFQGKPAASAPPPVRSIASKGKNKAMSTKSGHALPVKAASQSGGQSQKHAVPKPNAEPSSEADERHYELEEDIWAAPGPCTLDPTENSKLDFGTAFIAYGPNEDQKEEILPRVHNVETQEAIRHLVSGVQRTYVDGVPRHCHKNAEVKRSSVFHVLTETAYKKLSDREVQEILRSQNIVLHGQPEKCYSFKTALLTLGGGLDRTVEIQDQSIPWNEDNNNFVREGSLRDLCRHAESPTGNALNALGFPMGHKSMDPTPYASDAHALLFTTETPGWGEKSQFPTGDFRWGTAATSDAFTGWHLDANGLGTYVSPQAGSKWWVVARPVGNLDHSVFEDISLFENAAFDLNGNWGIEGDRPLFELEAVLLKPGCCLIMRPNTLHAVFTPQSSVTHGGHFYASSTMRDTLAAMFHTFVNERSITNSTLVSAGISLRRITAMWYHALVDGRMDTDDPASDHVPKMSSIDGLADLLAMCSAVELLNAMDSRTYSGDEIMTRAEDKNWMLFDVTQVPDSDREANQYARGQCRRLMEWVDLRQTVVFQTTASAPTTGSVSDVQKQLLRHHCKLLLLSKHFADGRKVSRPKNFTIQKLSTQLEAIYGDTLPSQDQLGAQGTAMFDILKSIKVSEKAQVPSPLGDTMAAKEAKDLMKAGRTKRDELNESWRTKNAVKEGNLGQSRKRKRL